MGQLEEKEIVCPYCGESIVVLVEPLISGEEYPSDDFIGSDFQGAEYIEDCQVCCRPITLRVSLEGNGYTRIDALHENE